METSETGKSLEDMTYEELLALQDQALIPAETNLGFAVRFSEGRIANLALGIFFSALFISLFAKWWSAHDTRHEGNPLLIIPAIGSLFLGVFVSEKVWLMIGQTGRVWARRAIHYWPVTLYAILAIAVSLKK